MNKEEKARAEFAKLMGLEYKPQDEEDSIQEDRRDEAIIAYFLYPQLFKKDQCRNPGCGKTFKVSRRNVGLCSRKCRRAYIRSLGFPDVELVFPKKGENDSKYVDRVWQGNEPLIVPPEALEHLPEQVESTFDEATRDAISTISYDDIIADIEGMEENVDLSNKSRDVEDFGDNFGLDDILNL